MNTASLTQNDKDLIIALTDDFLNIYRVRPEEDLTDVIKLDGFITDGIGDNWNDLCYSMLLKNYSNGRVHPEDRESFLESCSCENLKKELSDKSIFVGKYRILVDGETHYYDYKYVKVSAPGEPLRAVVSFRNIDELVAQDQLRIQKYERLKTVLATNKMGTWSLFIDSEGRRHLNPDEKMKEIIGIPFDSVNVSGEGMAHLIEERVVPADKPMFDKFLAQLKKGERAECTYRWIHPTMGIRYMRNGGMVASSGEDGTLVNGFYYDVTEQIAKETRSNLIIKTLAQTYEFVNYITLDDDTFFTYSEKEIEDEAIIDVLMAGSATSALRVCLSEIVSDDYRQDMTVFSDLSTINERMQQSNVLTFEFQDVNDIWYESSFAVADRKPNGEIRHLLWAIRLIDNEKQIEIRKQKMLEDNIAANKQKTKFLQNMSHEIRTPLNAMFGFAQLLGLPDGSWTEEEKTQYNSYIYNSYKMLEMLISDIIDIADSEQGNYRIEISDVDVNEICRNATMSVEYRVPMGVRMYSTSDIPDGYTVKSDGRRIQQVLINYLTNACKNTQQGEIHLHSSNTEHPGKITFSVADTGPGIPKAKADVIFNRFTKLNQFVQGSGLGLNICQTIASKLNGEVYLDTEYTNGARFVFVIDDKQE